MVEYFASQRKHDGPAEMPTKEELRVASKIARNRAKRLQTQVGSNQRVNYRPEGLCVPATVFDSLPDSNRTWVIDSGSCVNLVRTDELTKDEASRIRPVPGGRRI